MRITPAIALIALTLGSGALQAQATQSFRFNEYPTGPHAYEFPNRDASTSLAYMEQRRREEEAREAAENGGFPGMGGSGGTIAVGNWQQYYLIVGDGSSGTIVNKSPQADWGTQTSTSNANLNSTQTQNNSTEWTGSFDGQTTVQQGTTCATCAETPAWNWAP